MIYYAHFRLWPVFYPMAFEFSCLMYLTGLKVYYEVTRRCRQVYLTIPHQVLMTMDGDDLLREGKKLSAESFQDVRTRMTNGRW